MSYGWLADLVVTAHFAFLGFLAVGAILALRWPVVLRLHVPAVFWATAVVPMGLDCPLTSLENLLRRRSQDAAYQGSFIDYYIHDVAFPGEFTVHTRVIVALTVVAGYVAMWSRNCRRDVRESRAVGIGTS